MKVGLTGGIGCGKSTVVGLFADAGWRTIESDALVRGLLATNAEVSEVLRDRWGDGILDRSGGVDRKVVAARVFAEESELKWLEGVLHPLVRAVWTGSLREAPEADWLVEIPLLFEKRLENEFDFTVCVTSPSAVVEDRMVRRGYTGGEVERRRQRQMPLEEKAGRADFVISNAGSLEFLHLQTTRLIAQLLERR